MANGEQHPINGLMNVTLEKIKEMVDANTIIGNPISTANGTMIIPVNKVTFGFTSGGSDIASTKTPKELFGGGAGAGVSMQPIAFLIINPNGDVRTVQLADKSNTVDRALNLVPEVMDKVSGFINKDKKKTDDTQETQSTTTTNGDELDVDIVEVVE